MKGKKDERTSIGFLCSNKGNMGENNKATKESSKRKQKKGPRRWIKKLKKVESSWYGY